MVETVLDCLVPNSEVATESCPASSPQLLSHIYCNLHWILVSLQGVGLASEQCVRDDSK